jgi:ABC-type polysaccharide/polyol phosphate export permease
MLAVLSIKWCHCFPHTSSTKLKMAVLALIFGWALNECLAKLTVLYRDSQFIFVIGANM